MSRVVRRYPLMVTLWVLVTVIAFALARWT